MENHNIMIVALHDKPDSIEDCIKLLNDEWPRSKTARNEHSIRLRSIESSNPNLPISLIMVSNTTTGKGDVIGHAKIARLPFEPASCMIESVLINPANRGKGFGKLLMEECEKLAVKLGFSTAVLSTHDKQQFYQKLGYEFCQPVSQYGGGPSPSKPSLSQAKEHKIPTKSDKSICHEEKEIRTSVTVPQPPPLPKSNNAFCIAKVYMKKSLNQ
ncbi:N-alpha-acetyltransferase 80 isoform X1 [Daphnia magna]|uniref:N-alpha-acetyltransferase 80 isoform X1 n=1 Tax=Daphnia magna TaxID=35525 RepID=UPI001E1BA0DC|nr:N-alpha-acetyltransferase 80 isoform X1 [Daphnia magna]XP_045028684.1 N-alpha-acetyltransferase 80 isoform X1 [Daphnia magna]